MFDMTHKERAKQVVNPSGYRPGGREVSGPHKLKWRESGPNEVDYCCYVIGYDRDTQKPLFCGEVADFVAETGPGRATAMCKKHFDAMSLKAY